MDILGWLDTAKEYEPLIKTGVAAASTYASYQDQKKKNLMQQQAYDDYMKQVAEAGKEARAAIDINYTPMVVSGVPTTKADVTDFTAVAAKGGLMSIPNRQRKRYARGPEEVDVMEMDEEVITPESFKMETGVDVTGEQVQYNTGNPRQDAWGIWNSGGIDQEIYEFDFEIFFDSGDWMDMLKGQAPAPAQNIQMASAPNPDAERAMAAQTLFGKPLEMLNQMELEQLEESIRSQIATGGIAGLRHGGRPGYNIGDTVTADTESVVSEVSPDRYKAPWAEQGTEEIEGQMAGPDWYIKRIEHLEFLGYDYDEAAEIAFDSDRYYEIVGMESKAPTKPQGIMMAAKGGRIGYALGPGPVMDNTEGGIMDMGGLEKDYRTTGGFVPIGEYEKKDDVPARLSKNEFVMTADAVRAAGGGSINKGAQRMYDTMKHLEAQPTAKRMTA